MRYSKVTPAPFFIVGAQRSGTTLLRLILNAHSKIAIPEEARFLIPLFKQQYITKPISGKLLKNTINYLALNSQYQQWNYDTKHVLSTLSEKNEISLHDLINLLYSSFAEHEGKQSWADKSLFFQRIDFLAELFPEARFIHLVRDGRDVFHSWRNMDKTKNNITATALDWNYKINSIEKSFSKLSKERKLTIRYEDLLQKPKETIQHACSFLKINFEEEMLNYHKTSHYYIGEHHSSLIFKGIDSKNKYKWRKNLSTVEIRAYELICGNNLKKYDYELSNMKSSILDLGYILSKLLTGIPQRVYQVLSIKFTTNRAFQQGISNKEDTGVMPKYHKKNN